MKPLGMVALVRPQVKGTAKKGIVMADINFSDAFQPRRKGPKVINVFKV